ncbi:VTC domain-containing protein [Methanosarcina sp.]|uniref:VTC domain-containing protein n=1 Tax=Methanosarcina sp. TaxID=2213 RepID=UPI003C792F50
MLSETVLDKMQNPEEFRYERKVVVYGMSMHEVELIVKSHPAIFTERNFPRHINNIYLDTYNMSNYFDNVDGLSRRLKVRIRWYGDLLGFIESPVLEFKTKRGLVGGKICFPLNSFCLDSKYSLEKQQEIFMRSDIPEVFIEYLKSLRFTLLNRYYRKYFESSDHRFRITIDSGMEYYRLESSKNSFNEKKVDHQSCILELKYSKENEDFSQSFFNYFPFRLTKCSKYASGIENLYS